jgi:5-methylcytosine-specific restriction endonuclease McrA
MKAAIKRILNQQPLLLASIGKTCTLCEEITEDRINHIHAIQHVRRKTFYDDMKGSYYYSGNRSLP